MKEAKERNAKARAAEGKIVANEEEDDEEDFHSSRIKWARVLLGDFPPLLLPHRFTPMSFPHVFPLCIFPVCVLYAD